MSKEWLVESTTIRACKSYPGASRCEAFDCRWGMIGILVDTEFVEPKRESATIKLCGNVGCFDSLRYTELLEKHKVATNQRLIIKTYKNDNGNLREVAQVKNNI